MKREYYSSSPPSPSSPFSNSEISDELEPAPKRPRFFLSSQTPPPDNDDEDITEEEEETITDESIILLLNTTEDSQSEDNDIIEIEQQNDNTIVVVSDSDNDDDDDDDDDQGIDITGDSLPSVPSIIDDSISSPDIVDVEIVQEELTLMDDEEEEQQINSEDDYEFLEFLAMIDENTNDNNNNNNNNDNSELIDLTEDEPLSVPSSPIPSGRKLSVDVQQCPICLETLSHLQRTGVYLIITRCRHVMCTLCSRQLLAISSRCPLCREDVSSTTLMPYCILT
ncbi:unnamed protein product [Adineta steineri]|uniref:RING-type domain-containing protein n=1 Tax=Adineta steineri TaxID=433720 RepID=A0A813N5E3_9BILA|nr:unnamed protein product [Adineta steineri]CAF0739508.1 unnamed protein product [Adineta steineri]CAF0749373.1 unnamed protein product [Adineta steineri]